MVLPLGVLTLYRLSVTLHLLAAMLWVGGMGLFAIVVVPVARRTLEPAQTQSLLRGVGTRFARVGWWVLGTLLVTGIMNLACRGNLSQVGSADFWGSSFGTTLAAKLLVVALVASASAIHGRDARTEGVSRARASWLGRATLLLSLVVVVLAVFLVRGAPW